MATPLDGPTAAKYGELVNGAYDMFTAEPHNLTPSPSSRFLKPGWSWTLIAWITMKDFILGASDDRFYGVVLQSPNPATSGFDYAIAIRGTEGPLEWIDDAMAVPVPFTPVPNSGRVAYGFDKIYSTLNVIRTATGARPQVAGQAKPQTFAEQVDALVTLTSSDTERAKADTGEPKGRFLVTAHSLGAALATLYVMENTARKTVQIDAICTFASPRVGWSQFVAAFDALEANGLTSWRIANVNDVVTWVPPKLIGYRDVDDGYTFSGAEFAKNTVLCMHHMATYQHWCDRDNFDPPEGCALEQSQAASLNPLTMHPAIPDSAISGEAQPVDASVRFTIDATIARESLR